MQRYFTILSAVPEGALKRHTSSGLVQLHHNHFSTIKNEIKKTKKTNLFSFIWFNREIKLFWKRHNAMFFPAAACRDSLQAHIYLEQE